MTGFQLRYKKKDKIKNNVSKKNDINASINILELPRLEGYILDSCICRNGSDASLIEALEFKIGTL